MWPWEHAVVGYLTFSIGVHLLRRRPPTAFEAIAVTGASVLPDLIDKPLAWEFGVLRSGYGAAHSVFVAAPLASVLLLVAVRFGRPGTGVAFGLGYHLHLAGDVVPGFLAGEGLAIERILWPVATVETTYEEGFAGTLLSYLTDAARDLLSGPPGPSVLAFLGLMTACVLLWTYDGMPGVREPVAYCRRRYHEGRE